MKANRLLLFSIGLLFITILCQAQNTITVEQYVTGYDSFGWEYEKYNIVARYTGRNEAVSLGIFIESDGYKIPVILLNRDMNAEQRFLDMNLQPGDEIMVKGRGSMVSVGGARYKGLVEATITCVNNVGRNNDNKTPERANTIINNNSEGVEPSLNYIKIPFNYNDVEVEPSFKGGGADEFSKWVNSRLKYPEIAKENGVQGRVTLQFTVESDGRVTNVRVLRGVDPSLDAEAKRVVRSSPKWKPGMQNGEPVRVTYTFPIIFQLR